MAGAGAGRPSRLADLDHPRERGMPDLCIGIVGAVPVGYDHAYGAAR